MVHTIFDKHLKYKKNMFKLDSNVKIKVCVKYVQEEVQVWRKKWYKIIYFFCKLQKKKCLNKWIAIHSKRISMWETVRKGEWQ